MSILRNIARGKPCLVRLDLCCHDWATTALAHYRLSTCSGVALKPNDILAAWACKTCHDECDRRTRKLDHEFVRLAHAEGCLRTQDALVALGFDLRRSTT